MRACVYMYLIGLPDVLGVLASADWALAPVVAMATAATRTVDLEIMIDMSGVCGGVEVRGCVGVGVGRRGPTRPLPRERPRSER